ncbi:MAG TPA: lipoyl(octanoyl) transferase LipB [Woeseiaceae bacterium]
MNEVAAAVEARPAVIVRRMGLMEYEPLWRAMQQFTEERDAATADEIWFTEHPPVFTLGMNASAQHLLAPGDIPVFQIDRGGQVTYHGPGQLMIYPLIDLRRSSLGVRDLVTALEQAAVATITGYGLAACSRPDAPGVYTDGKKIASVGLRVRRGASFHGMAFNVAMDLEPFCRINPCGFSNLQVTDLRSLGVTANLAEVRERMSAELQRQLWGGSPARND